MTIKKIKEEKGQRKKGSKGLIPNKGKF